MMRLPASRIDLPAPEARGRLGARDDTHRPYELIGEALWSWLSIGSSIGKREAVRREPREAGLSTKSTGSEAQVTLHA